MRWLLGREATQQWRIRDVLGEREFHRGLLDSLLGSKEGLVRENERELVTAQHMAPGEVSALDPRRRTIRNLIRLGSVLLAVGLIADLLGIISFFDAGPERPPIEKGREDHSLAPGNELERVARRAPRPVPHELISRLTGDSVEGQCTECFGFGTLEEPYGATCPDCEGRGWSHRMTYAEAREAYPCSSCEGAGREPDLLHFSGDCAACEGHGFQLDGLPAPFVQIR